MTLHEGMHDFFHKAERVEQLAADIYRAVSERLASASPTLAEKFARLSEEEEQHVLRVRMLFDEVRADPSLMEDVDLDFGILDAIIPNLEMLEVEVNDRTKDVDARRIAATVAALKDQLANTHAEQVATRIKNDRVSAFFAMLAAQDKMHAGYLRGDNELNPQERLEADRIAGR